MNLMIFIFVASLVSLPIAISFGSSAKKTESRIHFLLPEEQSFNNYNIRQHLISLLRMRRNPGAQKKCGPKFRDFVKSVCDGPCTISSEVDLASKCCLEQCSHEQLRTKCCPT